MRHKKTVAGKKPLPQKRPAIKRKQEDKLLPAARPVAASGVRDAALESRLLAFLGEHRAAYSAEQLSEELSLAPMVVQALADALWDEGALMRTKRGAYAVPEAAGLLPGTVQMNTRGDAFFVPQGGGERQPLPEPGAVLHGDAVWVYGDGARRGRLARIVRRANETIVGVLTVEGHKVFVQPDDMRLPERIPLDPGVLLGAKAGDLVVARVLRWEDEGGLRACVQQLLGDAQRARSGLMGIVHHYGLTPTFDEACIHQAQEVAAWGLEQEVKQRLDLRELVTFTIDGADAQDFDDAISIETLEHGAARLGVHIADVSWYVRAGTTLDSEARSRATSVYLPGLVLPMLPEAISNGSCSLLPGEDRLTFSLLMSVDAHGEVTDYKLTRAVIRSHERLIYDDVNQLLSGDLAQVARYGHLLPDLQRLAALAGQIRQRRYAKGSLDFDLEEAAITVDEQGEPIAIAPRPRGASERMIEDFMLLANETVARHAKARNLPFLYRVHEAPDGDKFQEFATFLQNLGLRIHGTREGVTPKALQQVLEEAESLPEYPVIAKLMLRAMQKARYAEQPMGHFGLATADYCHFTAPIRRYPDLFIHRMLAAELSGELATFENAMRAQAQMLATHTSERERNAMEAERAADKLMMAHYMLRHIGEEFSGVISSVVDWGMYVTLENTVEGLVHVRTLPEYFAVQPTRHCLVGEHSGTIYRLGQTLRVRVESVDVAMQQINLVLVG